MRAPTLIVLLNLLFFHVANAQSVTIDDIKVAAEAFIAVCEAAGVETCVAARIDEQCPPDSLAGMKAEIDAMDATVQKLKPKATAQ